MSATRKAHLRPLLAAALLLGGLLFSGEARADRRADARRHFDRGMELIAEGELVSGAEELLLAHEILPHPAVLFNVARAYADAGLVEEAIPFFEEYLESEPPDAQAVRALVAGLESRLGEGTEEEGTGELADPPPDGEPALDGGRFDELLARLAAIEEALGGDEEANAELTEEQLAALSETRGDLYEEVVISASRVATSPVLAPQPVTIISADQIRASGAMSIPEALRLVAGVSVLEMGSAEANVAIRGFNQRISNKTLVLIDGRSVYQDFLGGTFWRSLAISLEDIDRIEILKGPGSTLYGANAFGGVINIITRPTGERGGGFSFAAGTQARLHGNLRFGGRQGIVGYRVSVGYEQAHRFELEIASDRADLVPQVKDTALAVRAVRAHGAIAIAPQPDAQVEISGGISSLRDQFLAIGVLRDFTMTGQYGHLRADARIGGLKARVFWNRLSVFATPTWAAPGVISLANHVRTDVVDAEVSYSTSLRLGVQQDISLGGGYRVKSVAWDYLPEDALEHHLFAWVEDRVHLGTRFHIVGGFRVDLHPLVGPTPSGSLALIFQPSARQAIRLNVGTAFRTPTFSESYVDLELPTSVTAVHVRTLGNLELAPEQNFTVNLGYHFEESPRVRFSIDAYYQRVRNFIALSEVTPVAGPERGQDGSFVVGTSNWSNLGDAFNGVGGELSARFFPVTGLDFGLQFAGQYTFNDEGEEDRRNPRILAGGQVAWRAPFGLEASVAAHYVGQTIFPERGFDADGAVVVDDCVAEQHLLLNARLGMRLPGDRVRFAATGNNLLGFAAASGSEPNGLLPSYRDHCLATGVGPRVMGHVEVGF